MVWPRQPTDPSRWTWKQVHRWKWKHSGHITEPEMRSALTVIRWRTQSSSLLRTRFVLFIGACQVPFQFSQAQCFRAEDSCNPALHGEQALVRVYGHRSQPCGRRFAQPACHVEELQLHRKVVTPLVVLCSTHSRNIAHSLVARKGSLQQLRVQLRARCRYNGAVTAFSTCGFVMKANLPHLTKMVLMLSCANISNGSGMKELTWVGRATQLVVVSFSCKRSVTPGLRGNCSAHGSGRSPLCRLLRLQDRLFLPSSQQLLHGV